MTTHTELLTHLDEQGYVLLEGVLSSAQAAALRSRSIELAEQEHAAGAARYLDGKSQRVWNLVNKDPLFAEVIQLPAVLALHETLLGADCILSSFTVNLIGPGSPAGALHIDYPLSKLPTPCRPLPSVPTASIYSTTLPRKMAPLGSSPVATSGGTAQAKGLPTRIGFNCVAKKAML